MEIVTQMVILGIKFPKTWEIVCSIALAVKMLKTGGTFIYAKFKGQILYG